MKLLTRMVAPLVGTVALLSFPGPVFSQDRIAGIIEEISGPAYWRKNSRDREIKLDPKRDRARIIHVGEQVRTGSKGRLRLFLCATRKEIASTAWFTIPAANECPNQAALDEYGAVGGRRRGEQGQLLSPSDHSVVWPDRFLIRWIPSTAKCSIQFNIKEADGPNIWRANGINGSLGRLNSGMARKRLKEYRSRVGIGPLRLGLVDSCANEVFVTFSLISAKSEAALRENLQRWNKHRGHLMFHLGRAYVFERYRIFPAVAEELEAALKIAPDSRDLLVRTIFAQRAIGNDVRESELKARLPPETTVP